MKEIGLQRLLRTLAEGKALGNPHCYAMHVSGIGPKVAQCMTAKQGGTVTVGPHECAWPQLRLQGPDLAWPADYPRQPPQGGR